ncbi:DNA-processing protein DprA [Streptomyces roseicoloratus]|uniref:DNA-processing protein DprA n=1 Tax=Streptomyces roseicoloratus TaxID=2508722 RepID=A0ABY9RRN9_9ACTN|nr:DNA-processing protein DprA [Streptomyces roseicoloratus]WMX44831.1 DNA-processing protein DprA [Streptomyces roseicoloratus]
MTSPSDTERLARAALTHIIEPGDEHAGRALRNHGALRLLELLTYGDNDRLPTTPDSRPAHPATAPARDPGPAPHDGTNFPGTGERRIAGWRRRARTAAPQRDLDRITRLGGRFLIPGDTEWPSQLDDLGDARPIGLWVRGPADLRTWALRSVALVGARACTPYGAHTAATLATGLAEHGWVVVSGAAFGIDGAAHRGALGSGGATIAVLACGVDAAYPRGHTALIRRIAEQGLVIGELPPGGHPTRSRFILRNRVIAALTRGTVVVEAEYRSGSLVTARAAARLGRHTMGVPGPVTSGLSAGVHELLRGEATLVTDAAEIIELIGDIGQFAPPRHGPVLPRDLLDPDTARILEALPGHHAAPLDDIAARAGAHPDHTLAKLYELHSLGFVERHQDDWRLTNSRTRPSNTRHGGP